MSKSAERSERHRVITAEARPVGVSTVFWLHGADDDYTTAARVLCERGVRLVRLGDVDELLNRLEQAELAMCVIDLAVGSGGGQALRAVRKRCPRALVVGIVDPRRRDGALEAFQKGVFDVPSEPVSILDFASVVRNADEFLALANPTAEESPATPEANGLVLASGPMRRLMELVHRVGMARCHVMVAGESGTGRETVARLLHVSSARSTGPFIKLDCDGASSLELSDTLFGRGSTEGMLGWAESGSLFLEHAEEMSSKLQRLARVLRSAADSESSSAIRVFIAVRPDIADLVRDGKVRPELYQQLALVRVEVPPLRDRRDDIPLLARQMLSDLCRTQGYPRKTLTRSAVTLLGALPWPGNLPELRRAPRTSGRDATGLRRETRGPPDTGESQRERARGPAAGADPSRGPHPFRTRLHRHDTSQASRPDGRDCTSSGNSANQPLQEGASSQADTHRILTGSQITMRVRNRVSSSCL